MQNIVGQNIAQRRKELGMTQTDLAKKLGYIARSSICSVEKGKEQLTTERVRKFAKALDCTPADLMGWEVTKTESKPTKYYNRLITAYENAPFNVRKSICVLLNIPYVDVEKKSSEVD